MQSPRCHQVGDCRGHQQREVTRPRSRWRDASARCRHDLEEHAEWAFARRYMSLDSLAQIRIGQQKPQASDLIP